MRKRLLLLSLLISFTVPVFANGDGLELRQELRHEKIRSIQENTVEKLAALDKRKKQLDKKYKNDPEKLKKIDIWFEMRTSQIEERADEREKNHIGDGEQLKNVAEKIKKVKKTKKRINKEAKKTIKKNANK